MTTKRAASPASPGSPGAPSDSDEPPAKNPRSQDVSPANLEPTSGAEPPPLTLPPSIVEQASTQSAPTGAPRPDAPPNLDQSSIIGSAETVGPDESYGNDEKQLNEFMRLHPMLSLEATSAKTLTMLSTLFQKASIRTAPLPVIPKSHDDLFLKPAKKQIGERDCICGDRCLARFVAQIRYGKDTNMAFTNKEFLLPEAYANFLNGRGLPAQRSKCLLCSRYFCNYIYLLARTDPSFKIENTPLGVQVFSNACVDPPQPMKEEAQHLEKTQKELPTHASLIACKDGYKADAMLFVDEDFVNMRSAREGKLGNLLWHPVVRFCSRDYQYVMTSDGPAITQVGIGADDHSDGLHFRGPAAPAGAPSANATAN